jgi:hypothetical protein
MIVEGLSGCRYWRYAGAYSPRPGTLAHVGPSHTKVRHNPRTSHLDLAIEFDRDSRTEREDRDHVNATAKSARGDCCDPHVWRRRHLMGRFCTRGELPFRTKFHCPAWQALVLQGGSHNSSKMLVYARGRSGGCNPSHAILGFGAASLRAKPRSCGRCATTAKRIPSREIKCTRQHCCAAASRNAFSYGKH